MPLACFMFIPSSARICLHTSLGIRLRIDPLSPLILCFADGMCQPPPCLCSLLFLPPTPPSSLSADWETDDHPFEPITQPDPLIITNLPESLIWGLPNSALRTMWLFVACPAALPPAFLFNACAREGSQRRRGGGWVGENRTERAWKRGAERWDCLHTFAHLSLGMFYQSERRRVRRRVSIPGTQRVTHKGFISCYLPSTAFKVTPLPLPFPPVARFHRGTCCSVNYTKVRRGRRGLAS